MRLPIAHTKFDNALNLTPRKNTGPPPNVILGQPLPPLNHARFVKMLHFNPTSEQPPLTNVVYMGMGEPLDNPFAVKRSLQVLTHPHTFAMAKSKISVSTVGPSPGAVRRMKGMPSRLAWSVHAATDEVRRLLVPTTVHTMTELR